MVDSYLVALNAFSSLDNFLANPSGRKQKAPQIP
jgi:hypothetical protein